ncbi:MFS transporter [Chitinophaga defluvii]|uniref:MFS transporter n=1 Tax=Chitinophaga defluvii TaxID=3163343 RepID=A0ABV2T4F6_9BACT
MNFIQQTIHLYRKAYTGLSPSIWWLSVVLLINRSGTMVIPFMTMYLTLDLHFSIAEAGLAMAFFGMGSVLGAYIGGRLADKIGFSQVQFWSLFFTGVLFMTLGQMQTLPQICACIFVLSSVGEAFRPANAAAVAYYSAPANRTRSYSLNRLAANLGWSVGPAVGGILASYSYHLLFWVDGFTCIVAAIFLRLRLPQVRQEAIVKAATHPATGKSAYKDKLYLWFVVLVMLNSLCFFQMTTIVPVYLKKVVHISEWGIGLILALNGIIIALVEMVLVYRLEGKRSNLYYISRGVLVISMAYWMLSLLPPVTAVAVFYILFITVGEMLGMPFMNSFWISRSTDHNRGQYAALYTMAYAVANVVSPSLGAYVVGHLGFPAWWGITGSICLLAVLGFVLLQRKIKAAEPEDVPLPIPEKMVVAS